MADIDKWWGRLKCPWCHQVCGVQRWGDGEFRVTCDNDKCEKGFVTKATVADGSDAFEGEL